MFRFRQDRLKTKEKLGSGRFGAVFPYKNNEEDVRWVVKRIRADDADALLSSLPEIVLGFACDHPCIVPLKGYFIEKDSNQESFNIYMKLPRMKETLLSEFKSRLRNNKPYSEQEITRHFYSLACGLEYLHSKKIYHGDIKPDNLLLDENEGLKITDVGIAKHVEEEDSYQTLTGQVGTYHYSAPEIIRANSIADKKDILPKADIWSLGTVILELCAFDLKLLNSSLSQEEIKSKVNKPLGSLEGKYKGSLIVLIDRMLRLDPNERPGLEEIKAELEENFVENLDQDFLKMANSHKLLMEAKYQDEIAALNQQIQEVLIQSKLEKDLFNETISRLELNLSQQKQQYEDKSKLEKDEFNEAISRLELNISQQKQHLDKSKLEKDQFNETISRLELNISQQSQQYDDKIKALLDKNANALLEKDKVNKDLQGKIQEHIQLALKKNSPRSSPRFLFSVFKGIILHLFYLFLLILILAIVDTAKKSI